MLKGAKGMSHEREDESQAYLFTALARTLVH